MVITAEEAIERAIEVARKAGVGPLFLVVTSARRVDKHWEVVIEWQRRKYRVILDEDGRALEWGSVEEGRGVPEEGG